MSSFSLSTLSFCTHPAISQSLSFSLLFSFCHHSVSLTKSSVLGLSTNPLLHSVSLNKSYICTHFGFLLQWITSSHKMAKTQLINYMESRILHAKLGFATTAKCSTPTGQRSTKLHKKNTYDEEIIFDDIWRPNNNLHVKPFRAQL